MIRLSEQFEVLVVLVPNSFVDFTDDEVDESWALIISSVGALRFETRDDERESVPLVETNGARMINQLMVCSYGEEEDLYVKFRLKRCGIQHLKRKY